MAPPPNQLDLFGAPARPPVGPAPAVARHAALAAHLPPTIRLGTSSWSFPGWAGLVYDRAYPTSLLARHGLRAYSRHPLLRAAGLDRTYYGPMGASELAALAEQVPEGHRLLSKAHEVLTLARFPPHARYGARRGERNPRFLDGAYATDAVIGPLVEGLGDRLGPLVFQLAPQPRHELGGPEGFATALHRFLSELPAGPLYAVEVRNPSLLTEAYADALAAAGACHCVTLLPGMPAPHVQWARVRGHRGPALVVRWMLARGLTYPEAKARWAPFDRLARPDVASRAAVAALASDAHTLGQPVTVIVNNKAEGSAPLSVVALAEAIADGLGG